MRPFSSAPFLADDVPTEVIDAINLLLAYSLRRVFSWVKGGVDWVDGVDGVERVTR